MNMGALPTIAEKNPANFYHFMLDNEVYATTGGQPVPNAKNIAYHVIAQGSGYPSTYAFDNLEDFANNIEGILSRPGPVFVALKVFPEVENVPIGSELGGRPRPVIRPSWTCSRNWVPASFNPAHPIQDSGWPETPARPGTTSKTSIQGVVHAPQG